MSSNALKVSEVQTIYCDSNKTPGKYFFLIVVVVVIIIIVIIIC